MPIEISIFNPRPRNRGGSTEPTEGGTPVVKTDMVQVVGLVQLTPCIDTECRVVTPNCCPPLSVFGNILPVSGGLPSPPAVPTYENDWNTFLVDLGLSSANAGAVVTITLEQCESDTWSTVATLNSNTYGIFYPLHGWTAHTTYVGYGINWGLVLKLLGRGCYRIKFTSQIFESHDSSLDSCLVSEPFELRAWNCTLAHQSTKFESWVTGKIGSKTTDGKVFDLCGINWYDSLRLKGFFGFEKTPEYLEVLHEYANGNMKRIRDEAIQVFEWSSGLLPKWMHDRVKIYVLMSDTVLVSDYNLNNSDYSLRRKFVLKASGYEPTWYDKQWNRTGTVTVKFKEGYQGVIKSLCCDAARIL